MSIVVTVKADAGEATESVGRLGQSIMATERAAKQVRDEFGRLTREGSTSMDKLKTSTQGVTAEVNRLIGAMTAYLSLTQVSHLADEYTVITNKIRGLAEDQDNFNGILQRTYEISQVSRSSWEATVATYQRFQIAAKGLGASQAEILDMTETLAKGLKIGGATAFEASMSMMELSHSFQTGHLTGREFRVLMKDATPFMYELRKAAGLSAAEFAEMGKKSKITGTQILEWVAKAKPAIDAAFGKTLPTIADGFLMLKNAAAKFFGEAGTGSGVLQTMAKAMSYLVEHFDTFGKIILGVGEALIGLFVIGRIIALVQALTVAIAANPLGALLVALTVGISLLRQFGDELDAGIGKGVTVGDVLRSIWVAIKDLGSAIGEFLSEAWSALTEAFSSGLDSEGIEFSLRNVLVFMASFVDAAIALFTALKKTIFTVFGGLPIVVGEAFVDMARGAVAAVQYMINKIIDGVNAVRRALTTSISIDTTKFKTATEEGFREKYGPPEAYGKKSWTGDMADKAAGVLDDKNVAGNIGHVDLDFKNPLAGAGVTMREDLRDAWGADFGSSVARDFITGWVDGIKHEAKKPGNSRISMEKGIPDDAAHDEKGAKAYQRMIDHLRKELDSVTRAASPLEAAEAKLAKSIDVTTRAVKYHVIEWTGLFPPMAQAARIISETAQETEKARHPLEAWKRVIDDEISAQGLSNSERERSLAIRKAEDDMREKGLTIGRAEYAQIVSTIDAQRTAAATAKWRHESLYGPSNSDYDAFNARRTGSEVGIERGLNDIGRKMQDTAALSEKAFVDAFQGIEDALVQFVTKGKLDLGSLASMLEQDLARLLIRQGEGALFGPDGLNILPRLPGAPQGTGTGEPSLGHEPSHAGSSERRSGGSGRGIRGALASDEGQEAVTNIAFKQNGSRLATRDRLRSRS